MSEIDVTIIVPYRNASRHLRGLLECLVEQRLDMRTPGFLARDVVRELPAALAAIETG